MNPNSELVKSIKKFFSRQRSKSRIKEQSLWLLRALIITRRQPEWVNAGFVLPTVAMVSLVVVLLTVAILFRSFERSKNASNVRVNEAVMNAAAPAIDRARAKLDALFSDPTLPRGTPTDSALYDALKRDKYRLGDETRLKLAYDLDADNTTETSSVLENDETVKTGWKFAVDTDNNGLNDSYTLYGIYFRSPPRNSNGLFSRERTPLDARTPPMDNGLTNSQCATASGSASLVGSSSWFKLQSGNLGKSFFVYTVNVPITQSEFNGLANQTGFEPYKGNKGFVALEFQQDRTRIPLPYNAVWFENDLEIITGSTALDLNGRIHTNGNLLVGVTVNSGSMTLRQVSSKTSCFYNQENGQISVGGNVGNGSLAQTSVKDVTVDLYRGFGQGITTDAINATNKSTNSTGGAQIGFNDAAYNQRIAVMKTSAIAQCSTCTSATTTSELKTAVAGSSYPDEIKNNFKARVDDSDDISTASEIFEEEVEIYLRNRTRRVPFAEVADASGTGATTGFTAFSSANAIDPPASWREPVNSSNELTGATTISLDTSQLKALFPDLQQQLGIQEYLGDRVLVGNNLPAKWLQGTTYVGAEAKQMISSRKWTDKDDDTAFDSNQRWRNTQIQAIADLGISGRNGFWEEKAAEAPTNPLDSIGGVRIVTGAGIYVDGSGTSDTTNGPFYGRDDYSFLPVPTDPTPSDSTDIPVWPDTMPMSSPGSTRKGDLLMRATAVYHYKIDSGNDQEPIACVSSYYDPTNATTAKNKINVDGGYGVDTTNGKSNNGIVYAFPGRSNFSTNKALLERQANLKFPNGRWVNEPLKDALAKIGSGTTVPSSGLQLADYSAIDTALCAISILNGAAPETSLTNKPAHGAIKEAAFLDGREVKQVSLSSNPMDYNLDLEQRQPLEVRVTDIDLGSIASTAIDSTNEYLLPFSGIIYATRDDGLPDESVPRSNSEYKLLSPTDFVLDPSRRPNGIRLINGATLARAPGTNNNSYNAKEKGLILVSNLPAYIKGTFNLHRDSTTTTTEIEEFSETESSSNFYTRSTVNTKFACRINRSGCSTTQGQGDFWRPATIIADSMTLLSNGFVDGFRNEGDYDLNNNTGIELEANFNPGSSPNPSDQRRKNRLKNGFWENNFVTSANWQANAGDRFPNPNLGSYIFNGITPIQRRVDHSPMYVMEICRKDLVSDCQPNDWVVGFDANDDGALDNTEQGIKANQLGKAISDAGISDWNVIRARLGAGDTGNRLALVAADRRYPRRVAFARDDSNQLINTGSNLYKPIGIGCPLDTTGTAYANNGCSYGGTTENTNYGTLGNALWFRTTSSTTNPSTNPTYSNNNPLFYYPPIDADGNGSPDLDGQPLLVPVLQIHDANNTLPDPTSGNSVTLRADQINRLQEEFRSRWVRTSGTNTTYNATFVVGNSPSRPGELSAGLQNLVRFLETWRVSNTNTTVKISGSFIQLKRSAYSTAPIGHILSARQATNNNANTNTGANDNLSLFNYAVDSYPTPNGDGLLPFYSPPNRRWGFDVGLLSEQPDLFAQRFTLPPSGRPSEFFREVSRDDRWVQTLLCSGQASNQTGIPASGTTVTYSRAVPTEFRPSSCPTIPNN
jgi:Tfp pilus assembly protein PilX